MKCIALLSGGLDSTLAVKVILEQGIEVVSLNIKTPFCRCNRLKGCSFIAKKVVDEFGTGFKFFYMGEEYLRMLENPPHGYGKNVNPCIDCRILMFRKAKEVMEEEGASFIVSGEVLGQRPMSQHKAALGMIEKEAGVEGLVLRPLSAKLFPPSIPENEGWVDREKLLDFSGRSRKPQIELAGHLGVKDYPCPAGGCLLTDISFAGKLKDLIARGGLTLRGVELLKAGRHFRWNGSFKLIVGRNEKENEFLRAKAGGGDMILEPHELMGPLALGIGAPEDGDLLRSCRIVARYADGDGKGEVDIRISGGGQRVVPAERMSGDEVESLRI